MKRLLLVTVMLLGWATTVEAAAPVVLTSLRQIHALTNDQAKSALPVAFEATVTYFRGYEKTMFVQAGDVAIYVQASTDAKFLPGDLILIKGTTHESFRPFVLSSDLTLLRHGAPPAPVEATYDELIRSQRDCMNVTVHARVRAADVILNSGVRSVSLQMLADGGTIDAVVDSDDSSPFEGLLDADVEITGAASGRFDGKMQQTGILLHVPSWSGIKVLKRAGATPASLPVTSMDTVLTGYHVQVQSQRIKVHGTVTYYQPGTAIVLQDGSKSLWIQTHSINPIRVGDVADVTGFPGLHDGFLTLTNGEINDTRVQSPVTPHPATWGALVMSRNVFDLVSIEGQVVTDVREAAQDEYVLKADGQMFSAIYRHPVALGTGNDGVGPMRHISENSRIRVTGICLLDDSNPFNAQVPFSILLRSSDDITVVAEPSWLNVRNLLLLIGFLLVVVFAGGAWGWRLERRVRRQTAVLAQRIEVEAAQEHHRAQIEERRSRILEDINGSRPLAEILEQIVDLISFLLDGAPSWCEVTDGARLGNAPENMDACRIIREPVLSRTGNQLGVLFAALDSGCQALPTEAEVLGVGVRLATLAIETRRLYTDLLHRSEFDMLTDLHNRFSLDKELAACIERARQTAGIFGLIYIDLDEFKQVNDLYGHQVGDLYLQEAANRMKRQLRSHDVLARLGGDEFGVLLTEIPNRTGVEEIALRLERSLDGQISLEGYVLHGSASVGVAVYPEDGTTGDSLLSVADSAMYMAKHSKRAIGVEPGGPKSAAPDPKRRN